MSIESFLKLGFTDAGMTDKEINAYYKPYTKQPYANPKLKTVDDWYEHRGGENLLLRGGNTSGLSSKKVVDHFKKKYKLDVSKFNYTDPAEVNSFYNYRSGDHEKFLEKAKKISKTNKLPFWDGLFKDDIKKKQLIATYKDFYESSKNKRFGEHGGIYMDKEVFKHAPELTAHELGHAYNYNKTPAKYIYKLLRNPVAGILGAVALGIASVPTDISTPNRLLLGAAGLTPLIATLADEYYASKRAIDDMIELKGKPNRARLARAFNSYVPGDFQNERLTKLPGLEK